MYWPSSVLHGDRLLFVTLLEKLSAIIVLFSYCVILSCQLPADVRDTTLVRGQADAPPSMTFVTLPLCVARLTHPHQWRSWHYPRAWPGWRTPINDGRIILAETWHWGSPEFWVFDFRRKLRWARKYMIGLTKSTECCIAFFFTSEHRWQKSSKSTIFATGARKFSWFRAMKF